MSDLVLHVRREWFEKIKRGEKCAEYRLFNDYWKRRLYGRRFDQIIVCLGYPKKGDESRRLYFPWRGYVVTTVSSSEWNNETRKVFAIHLR